LNNHPEIEEDATWFRYAHDPLLQIDNPWIYGDNAVELSDPVLRQKMHSKYWKFHYSFYRHLYPYYLTLAYVMYIGWMFIISIIFYAVNSTLWT
jgi:hypothetical protein